MNVQGACALRRAAPADVADIEAFLSKHAATSMFLRSNLAKHGLEPSDAPHATEIFVHENTDGIRGVVGLSNNGYLLAQCPDGPVDLSVARARWQGRSVLGMTGVVEQVGWVFEAFGLSRVLMGLDRPEPLYELRLDRLAGPFETLRGARPDEQQMLEEWFMEYLTDIDFAVDDQAARSEAQTRATHAVQGTAVRLLDNETGGPVAMTTFNAEAFDTVQIGGVFVARSERNKGYARRIVAAHLAEARERGTTRAILSAASEAAARAYEAIGFERVGTYRIALFKSPETIPGVA